ncbi:MAG: DUF3884 family protein [Psychroflexus sp.]
MVTLTNIKTQEKRQNIMTENNYFTVKEFVEKNKKLGRWPTSEASVWFIRANKEKNGFKECFLKVGRRVLIDEDIFYRCVKEAKN